VTLFDQSWFKPAGILQRKIPDLLLIVLIVIFAIDDSLIFDGSARNWGNFLGKRNPFSILPS